MMRILTTALLALGLAWTTAARAAPAPASAPATPPAPSPDEGYLDDLPPLPPLPPPPADADALPQQWLYNGPHAIHADVGGGWCDQEGPHYHPYPPFDDQLFQEDDGGYDFLGDPTDFGYEGDDLSWYDGDHPIAAGWGIGWCFMTWPHRHRYHPDGRYAHCGQYWCYNGVRIPSYRHDRARWAHYWSTYPSHYWGGEYSRTHRPASPGRWGAIHPRPAGRPGGVATPTAGSRRPAGRRGGVATPTTGRPHQGARPITFPRARGAIRTIAIPPTIRLAPRPAPPPRTYYWPRRGAGTRVVPPAFASPRVTAPPRVIGPTRSHPMPRAWSAPRAAAPQRTFAAPRTYTPPRAAPSRSSAPSRSGGTHFGASSHGSSSHGGSHRR